MQTAEDAPAQLMLTRWFDVPRERVWQAWTDPEHLRHGWRPDACVNTDCVIEPHVGGVIRLTMHAPNGVSYPCRGSFLEIMAPERLVIEGDPLSPHRCGAGLPPKAIVTVTFDAQGDKTRLTLHTQFRSAAALRRADEAGFIVGWESTLDRLTVFL